MKEKLEGWIESKNESGEINERKRGKSLELKVTKRQVRETIKNTKGIYESSKSTRRKE